MVDAVFARPACGTGRRGARGLCSLAYLSGRPVALARRPVLVCLRLAILGILGLIIINPVRRVETPGPVERPRLFYLLDTSASMALGKGATRWEQAVRTLRDADSSRDGRGGAQVSAFRFGSRLAAVNTDFWRPAAAEPIRQGAAGAALAAEPARANEPPPAPTDSDSLLGAALEALAGRFGSTAPQALVVLSDGRASDAERALAIARAYGRNKLPIHVLEVGEDGAGGDVALVSMVAPNPCGSFQRWRPRSSSGATATRENGLSSRSSASGLTASRPRCSRARRSF